MTMKTVRRHAFLIAGFATGVAVLLASWLAGMRMADAAMLGWCAHVATYATLLLRRLSAAAPETMRRRAQDVVETRGAMLTLALAAAAVSLLSVVLQLASGLHRGLLGQLLAISTILLSWLFMQLLFAQDYAHEYWMEDRGLEFPGGDGTPAFSEFLYFSLTVGMTFQVSDVTTSTPAMRRIVMIHALIAFGFNAVIIAAAVNSVASLG